MKNVRHLLFLLTVAFAANAQTTFPNPFVNGQRPPAPVATTSVIGTPGITQYMYVVVAHYPSGDVPTSVLVVNTGNATLDSTNKIQVSWSAVNGALNYDVLRVTANPFSYASCTCALSAAATSSLSLTDTGAALNAYTAGTIAPAISSYWLLDNTSYDLPSLRAYVNGTQYQGNEWRGTTLPSYCSIGDHFFKTNATAGANEYLCTAANTWTQLVGGGAGSATITACGTTSTCAATNISSTAKVVTGSAALVSGTPSTVTITAIPAFTSTTSFNCAVTNQTNAANNLLKVVNTSTSSITITGPNTITDTVGFVCAGN